MNGDPGQWPWGNQIQFSHLEALRTKASFLCPLAQDLCSPSQTKEPRLADCSCPETLTVSSLPRKLSYSDRTGRLRIGGGASHSDKATRHSSSGLPFVSEVSWLAQTSSHSQSSPETSILIELVRLA